MTIKKLVGKIHLWLGFICGLVVVTSMLAASVFVWEEELVDWYHHDLVFVDKVTETRLPVDELLHIARQAVPGREIYNVHVLQEPNRSYVFRSYKKSKQPGFSFMSGMEYQDEVYVNQYSGSVLGVIDKRYDWIYMTRMLHQCLLLNYDVGHYVVGFASLFTIIMLITGLVLWWPKNKAAIRQRFKVKWNARWRRVNYDIHNVGGFYLHMIIFVLAVTGLVWTFDWWTNGIYRLLGNDPKKVFEKHEPPRNSPSSIRLPAQKALTDAISKREGWTGIYFNFPKPPDNTPGEFSAFVRYDGTSGWDESDSYYYHGQSGERHSTRTHEQKLLGEKWRNSNYAIHVGSIYGLPTKILACISALFLGSLPITGFCIWIGRKKKSDKKPEKSKRTNVSKSAKQKLMPAMAEVSDKT
jgi:uncharacterized iron-regulated membrane protein